MSEPYLEKGYEELRLKLPTKMMERVNEILAIDELAYEDKEEFFREAVRERLRKLEGSEK